MAPSDPLPAFREIQSKFPRLYAQLLLGFDLTLPQYALLNLLAASGSMTMTEASAKLHITKPAVTHLVDRLEEKGGLRRCEYKGDRRAYLLSLQPKGGRITLKIQATGIACLMKSLEAFGPQEKKTIADFYSVLAKNLDGILKGIKKK